MGKCLGTEVTAGSEVEVFPQILAKGQFGSGPKPCPLKCGDRRSNLESQPFTEMPEDHFELRVFVE
jgi:hypothetical protein